MLISLTENESVSSFVFLCVINSAPSLCAIKVKCLWPFSHFVGTSAKDQPLEVLPFAPTLPPRQLSEAELKKAREDEENTMRELRIFLRDVHIKLITDRRFKEFAKPVDLEEVRNIS